MTYTGPERRSPDRRERQAEPWPRRATVYLRSSKESMFEAAQDVGLDAGDEESWSDSPAGKFRYALYEVRFELEVEEDGTYRIVSVTDGETVLRAEVTQ